MYMDFCEKYMKKKVFVFLSLHSFFSQDELSSLFRDITYTKHNVLIIERYDCPKTEGEIKRIIDKDLCEI